jgi:predicted TIM-barrel fold metal-dependent hydrolase
MRVATVCEASVSKGHAMTGKMMRTGFGWVLAVLTAMSVMAGSALADNHQRNADLPIFDAHIHYKQPAWGPFPVKTVIELMDKTGVAMGLVSSTPDEGTIMLWKYAPKRIVPELRPYHGSAGSGNWTKAEGMLDYLKARMKKYPHRGIGEFHVHSLDPADKPLLVQVARLAMQYKVPIHIHSGAAPVKLFYEIEPRLTVIWAHAGMSEPPSVIGPLMDKHKSLYADTSFRESDILAGEGGLDPVWRKLLIKHQDRFMVGTDTWVNSQWENYEGLINMSRRILSFLPRAVAEKYAYKNAEALFGIKVHKGLIGTR